MHKQMLVSMKTIAKINKLLAEGWSFSHTIGIKQEYAILTKYQNGGLRGDGELMATPVGRF